MKKTFVIIMATAMLLTLLPATALAADATLTVGPGQTYETIQAAVNALGTEAGTKTITVKAGTYNETVQILQQSGVNIVLQGEDGVIFKGNIIIDGNTRNAGTETLLIKNIDFDKSGTTLTANQDFIAMQKIGTAPSYTHNVTIEGCTFVGDDSGKYTVGIRAGGSSNNAYNSTIRDCTFTQLHSAIQANSTGLTVENITASDLFEGGINTANSSNVTLANVNIDAPKYALRLGQSTGNDASGYLRISGCVLKCSSTLEGDGAIVLRAAFHGTVEITSSDILGNVDNNSAYAITMTTTGVYWGLGASITGFSGDQLIRTNDAAAPHTCPTSGDTEVTAGVDPTYTIVIPASVNFGSLVKTAAKNIVSKGFDVEAKDVVIENGAHIDVDVTTINSMTDGYRHALDYSLFNVATGGDKLSAGAEFASFTTAATTVTKSGRVEVDTSAIEYAGSYSGTMVFTITYVS